MLDGLAMRDDGGVRNSLVLDFAGRLIRLLDQAVGYWKGGTLRFLSELLEHLLKPTDLVARLFQMIFLDR